jgi:hypothetical protein
MASACGGAALMQNARMPLSADAPLNAESLNAALSAYVATFPSAERLRAHLEAGGLTAHAAQFELELKAAVHAAEESIYAAAGRGEKWDAAFNERFFQEVARQHPWISRQAFKSLGSFGQYLNWHDGLGL